jgi:predicted PurR-regulated permease PerM
LTPIAWAIVLTIVFYPFYAYICKYIHWKTVSSLITLVFVVSVILGPFSYLSINLAKELKDFLNYFNNEGVEFLQKMINSSQALWIQERIKSVLGISDIDLVTMSSKNLSKIGKDLVSALTRGVANVALVLVNFFIMLFAMFFMLRDAPDFLKSIRDYMPFSEKQKKRLESKMKDMVISTVYGGVAVAALQGTVGGMTFFFLGLSSPVLLGTAIGFMSFIPGLGAISIWLPVVIFLLVKKAFIKAIILLFVGTFIISLIDNILKPIIISGRTQMPTLVIFFSVIGGLKVFGLIGLVLGPLVIAVFVSVLEIFRNLEGGINAES